MQQKLDGRYQHLDTWNEILSQGDVWQDVLGTVASSQLLSTVLDETSDRKAWLFVGCGTSYHLAESAAFSWMKLTGQPARALPGSEVLLYPETVRAQHPQTQAVVISRSGKTSEAVRAAALLRNDLQVPAIGITCAKDSPLQQVCPQTFVLGTADEKSTVMTRSFTSMLLTLQMLAAYRAANPAFVSQLTEMAKQFAPHIPEIASQVESFVSGHSFDDYIFLAQGGFYGIAREAALKVMEMSCSYSQFFHALEFRHGPKSIVSANTCLTFYLSEAAYEAEAEVLTEMKDLGAVAFTVCNRATDAVKRASNLLVELNLPASELGQLAPSLVPSQLLGLFTGTRKGLNPDSPKNLTRVVMLD